MRASKVVWPDALIVALAGVSLVICAGAAGTTSTLMVDAVDVLAAEKASASFGKRVCKLSAFA